jgi:chemotaxis protein MotB
MRPKKKTPDQKDRWLISYADLLTLLFALFTTLYALSSLDAKKAASLSNAIQKAFHQEGSGVLEGASIALEAQQNTGQPEREVLINELTESISSEFKSKVTVRDDKRGVVISLADSAFFATGSAQLQSGALEALDDIAKELSSKELDILVEGHTDDSGRLKTNWELSTSRATAVVLFFIERHHFNPQRLSAAGYGQYRPISTNLTPEGRADNRRVDLVLQATPLLKETP